jgi:hypothetical protein
MIDNIKVTVITSLFKCEKYLHGYFNAVEKIINKNECEFLLLHNAPTENELKIINSNIRNKEYFVHKIIETREGLYSTWNRGIKLAKGKYCAIWNVDDIRFENSLSLQSRNLDDDEDCALVIGNINCSNKYGEIGLKLENTFNKTHLAKEVLRSCIITCFPMWRKSIHDTIGYFDEQFNCVSDFDFQIRVARRFKIKYIDDVLGVYLVNVQGKISNDKDHPVENNCVYLRYGIYDKLILHKIPKTFKKFNKNIIVNFKIKKEFNDNLAFGLLTRILGIFIALLKSPLHLSRDLYHSV